MTVVIWNIESTSALTATLPAIRVPLAGVTLPIWMAAKADELENVATAAGRIATNFTTQRHHDSADVLIAHALGERVVAVAATTHALRLGMVP